MNDAPRTTTTVSYLTDPQRLSRLIPASCEIYGEAVVMVEHCVLHRLEWLAGRSYSLLAVKFPVIYRGPNESVRGPFLSVLWENRVEPILTGREELGYPKLYCELPMPRDLDTVRYLDASIDGHTFVRLAVQDLRPAQSPPATSADGVLLHRYLPPLIPGGKPAADEMVMTPSSPAPLRYSAFSRGTGTVEFVRSTWQQLPTTFHIVNALADLPVLDARGASVAETVGATDLADTRRLR